MNYRLGDVVVDEDALELRKGGALLHVEPLVMRLILHLLRNPRRAILKEELLDVLWDGRSVSDSALTRAVSLARRALRSAAVQKPIRTLYGTGYQLAVRPECLSVPATPRSLGYANKSHGGSHARTPRFVGRCLEIRRLEAAFESVDSEGAGSLHLIAGEPGIGKSTLLHEVSRRALNRDFEIRLGPCLEAGGISSFWPWIQIVRQEFEARGYVHDSEIGHRLRERIGQFLLQTEQAEHSLARMQAPTNSNHQNALFEAITRLFARRAAGNPTLLTFDDIHRADIETLALLRFFSLHLGYSPILVLATYRPRELLASRPHADLIAQLSSLPATSLYSLGGLELEEAISLVAGTVSDREIACRLHERSSGNPLFLLHLAAALDSGGLSGLHDSADRLPQALHDVIALQVSDLSPETRRTLARASVIGCDFDLRLLRPLEGNEGRMFEALDFGIHAGILVNSHSPAQTRYRFSHVLVRDYFYETLGTEERARTHFSIAEHLAATDQNRDNAALIAHHYRAASPVFGTHTAIESTIAAADAAASRFAYMEAAKQYRLAVDLLAGAHEHRRTTCVCQLGIAEALMRSGDRTQAWKSCKEAVRLARLLRAPDLFARAALVTSPGFLAIETGLYNQAEVDLLEEAVSVNANSSPSLRVELLSRLATAVYWSHGDRRAPGLSADALRLAEVAGDARSLALALYARHSVLWRPGAMDERVSIARQLVSTDQASQDWESSLIHRVVLITDLAEVGNANEFERQIDDFCRDSRQIGQPDSMWLAPMLQSTRALMRGEFWRLGKLSNELHDLGARIGSEDAQTCWAAQTAMAAFETGTDPELIERLTEHASAHPNVTRLFWTAPAWAAAEFGQIERARTYLGRFAESDFETIPRDMNWLGSLSVLAMASAEIGDVTWCERIYSMLRPFADRFGVLGYAVIFLGSVAAHLSRLAAVCGNHQEADSYFRQGLRMNEAMGARPWAIRSRYGHGIARAKAGDGVSARMLLEKAAAEAREISMTHIAVKCQDALSELPTR